MSRSVPRAAALAAVALLALGACAPMPTPYQPLAANGGFSDFRIEENRFRVTFAGNYATPRETVERYLLVRAAEITRQVEADWFLVVDRETDEQTRFDTDSPFGAGFGFGYGSFGSRSRFGYGVGIGTSTSYPEDRFDGVMEILVFRGAKPADPNAYAAEDVLRQLSPGVVRAQPPA